jgi:hypothetical protein
MARIQIVRDAELEWLDVPNTWPGKAKDGAPGLHYKRILPHAPHMPNMQRTRYEPFHHEPPHSHPEDEVMFVLAGELFHGRDKLIYGDSLYIARDTTYSLRTEGEGAEFLRVGLSDLSAPSGSS